MTISKYIVIVGKKSGIILPILWGDTFFTTKAEAEAKLKELQDGTTKETI